MTKILNMRPGLVDNIKHIFEGLILRKGLIFGGQLVLVSRGLIF